MTQIPEPHGPNRTQNGTLRYWVTDVQTMDTPDFPAYSGTLTEHAVPVATFYNDGRGGATFVEYEHPQDREKLLAFLEQYPPREYEGTTFKMDPELFIEELVNQSGVDERAKRETVCLSEQLDDRGEGEIYALPGVFTLAQVRAWPQRPDHLTHVWVRGQGWMPLRETP